ncbi:MAG: SIS domain-containing protein [Hespellia sp.]|nr:SIS domain-containing protein [Hespellia sp.]
MESIITCIERVPQALENVLDHHETYLKELSEKITEKKIDEIIFIGSGTSNTSAMTARPFIEKVSKIRTTVVSSNEFMYDRYLRNPNALYVFTSQTGTSHFVREAQKSFREQGFLTVAITESEETPLAKESSIVVNMGSGIEDCPMRTIGYCTSVLTQMILGLTVGKIYGNLTQEEFDAYIEEARRLPASTKAVIESSLKWMDDARRRMFQSQLLVFTGAGSLYGLALEAAMKVWECPQIASVGYELEEGMHGPNYGYNYNHCVIVLNDGTEERKGLSLARWMKEVKNNGFVIGSKVVDDKDLQVELVTEHFTAIELSVAVQVIAYRLAFDGGRNLTLPHDNSVMESYFKTHD